MYAYLVRLTGDPDLSADLAQETFIRWIEHGPEGSHARAWLFTVATNLSRDDRRVRTRRLEILEEDPASVPAAESDPDPASRLEDLERARAVRKVLDDLPEKDRVILLMQQEGFSHREIAEAVGTTTGSVGTMLSRALKRFVTAAGERFEPLR